RGALWKSLVATQGEASVGLHADRAAGGYCHHRSFSGDAAPGPQSSPAGSRLHCLQREPKTTRTRIGNVRERKSRLSSVLHPAVSDSGTTNAAIPGFLDEIPAALRQG